MKLTHLVSVFWLYLGKGSFTLATEVWGSAVNCINAEIGIFLSLCGNTTVCHMPQLLRMSLNVVSLKGFSFFLSFFQTLSRTVSVMSIWGPASENDSRNLSVMPNWKSFSKSLSLVLNKLWNVDAGLLLMPNFESIVYIQRWTSKGVIIRTSDWLGRVGWTEKWAWEFMQYLREPSRASWVVFESRKYIQHFCFKKMHIFNAIVTFPTFPAFCKTHKECYFPNGIFFKMF